MSKEVKQPRKAKQPTKKVVTPKAPKSVLEGLIEASNNTLVILNSSPDATAKWFEFKQLLDDSKVEYDSNSFAHEFTIGKIKLKFMCSHGLVMNPSLKNIYSSTIRI